MTFAWRTLADTRLNRDRHLEQPRHFLHDRKPETDTHALRAVRVDLVVLIEDALELVLRDADAGVLDRDRESLLVLRARDGNGAAVRVLDRITDEVLQHLIEQDAIRRDDCAGRLEFEQQAVSASGGVELRAQLREDFCDRHGDRLRLDRAGFQTADVEQCIQ